MKLQKRNFWQITNASLHGLFGNEQKTSMGSSCQPNNASVTIHTAVNSWREGSQRVKAVFTKAYAINLRDHSDQREQKMQIFKMACTLVILPNYLSFVQY